MRKEMFDLDGFNDEQKEAILLPIEHQDVSDILIVAGAGSGKTRVLTYRIAYLRSQGVQPAAILALTFTRKAANEMQTRLASLLPGQPPVKMSTFHALAADLLRTFSYDGFDIIDDSEQRKLLKSLIKEKGMSDLVKLKDFMTWHSSKRNRCIDPTQPEQDQHPVIDCYCELAKAYKKAKMQIGAGVYDFDDLLEELVELLTKNTRAKEQLHRRWKYILVDEYQDTNRLQLKILNLLRGKNTQLLQVGDEDQLIYSWRGAEIDHIMRSYQESIDSDKVHCVTLSTNYRCSENILKLANAVVGVNQFRTGKQLIAHKQRGCPVSLKGFHNCSQEGMSIAMQMGRWHADGVEYGDMAVLMRTNRMARSLERALIQEGVPYQLHNGVALFDSQEVKLMMSLLKFTETPDETFFFDAILDTIKMGIGPAALKQLDAERKEKGWDWIACLSSSEKFSSKLRVKELLGIFPEAKLLMDEGDLVGAARFWFHHWDLMQFYKKDDREKKAETVQSFFEILEDYQHQCDLRQVVPTIVDFQEQRLLNDALTEKDSGGAVHIMTIHKAKGLEFRCGVVMGAQDGVFPVVANQLGDYDHEEDARLAYVAITRFMEALWLTRSYYRTGFKQTSMYSSLIDPHVDELMDEGVVDVESE